MLCNRRSLAPHRLQAACPAAIGRHSQKKSGCAMQPDRLMHFFKSNYGQG
jgi:hypothetical protein